MTVGRFGIAIQADADTDLQALKRFKHRPAKQGAVSLNAHVHLGKYVIAERSNEFCQPVRSGQKRLTAMQDDVDDVETMPFGMVGDALDGLGGDSMAHAFRHVTPRLVRHFVHITVRTRQVTPAVDLQDELTEGDRQVS